MRKKYLLKDEGGFTLIEIIAVLVIMGILAAVAVPKFFDLQTKAREKAVSTAISEMKVRVNQYFAKELLDGNTWSQIGWLATSVGTNLGADFEVKSGSWVIDDDPTDGTITFDLIYTKPDTPVTYADQVVNLPRYTN
jgi:prepilin-type N-terminal cleavage/methylation domain-containing protein